MDPKASVPETTEDERVREEAAWPDVLPARDDAAGVLAEWIDFYGAGFVDDFGA